MPTGGGNPQIAPGGGGIDPRNDPQMDPKTGPKTTPGGFRRPKTSFQSGAPFQDHFEIDVLTILKAKKAPQIDPQTAPNPALAPKGRPEAVQGPPRGLRGGFWTPLWAHFGLPRGDFRAAGARFLGSTELQLSRGFGIELRGLGVYEVAVFGFTWLLGFSSGVLGFSSGLLDFSSAVMGFSSGVLAFSSAVLGFGSVLPLAALVFTLWGLGV